MWNDILQPTDVNFKVPSIQTSNGRNCRDCSKVSVCRYQEVVTEEVEKLIEELVGGV